jgi:hypothetical protein
MADEVTSLLTLDVPQNGGYMVAAYIVAAAILVGYALSLYRRSRNR